MTEDKLINAIRELITNKELYINSRLMMDNLKKEDGVMNAINLIEDLNF